MLIGQGAQMIGSRLEVLQYFWDLISSLGVPRSRKLCLVLALKQNTKP
jgi:hypothetical protein